MHNGVIGNWSRLRRQVEALIPDEFYGSRIGTTDSEAVFLAILGAGGDKDPVGATTRMLATLTDMVGAEQGADAIHRRRSPTARTSTRSAMPSTTTPTRSIIAHPATTS